MTEAITKYSRWKKWVNGKRERGGKRLDLWVSKEEYNAVLSFRNESHPKIADVVRAMIHEKAGVVS